MARTLSAQTAAESTKPQPNAAALDGCIQAAFKAIYQKKQDIAAEMAAHVEDHKEDLRKLWTGLKKDTGLNRKDLELNFKLYERERDAEDIDDESEREKVMNGLRAGHRALKAGQMVNFLDVIEATANGNGADKTTKAKEAASVKEAKAAGRQAGQAGKQAQANPHAKGSDQHAAWSEGWGEGQDDLTKDLGRGPTAGAA